MRAATRGALRGWTAWAALAAGAVAIQFQAASWTLALGFQPELPLLLVVYLALHGRRETVLPGAVLAGSLVSLGTVESAAWVLAVHLGIALALLGARGLLFGEHPVTEAFLVFAAAIAYRAAGVLMVVGHGGLEAWTWTWVPEAAVSAGVTTGLAGILFPAFRRWRMFRGLVPARAG